ncbi:hypothetical protein CANARDRAFT_200428 [[Candida] arabinofermentans NRRL YB-2248]|uniref:Thioredoxin domain-containing protein n=1 Tax=[Candida] arabinofermentans NRRL YB-2248 TaxID=983967 RepID=A0A1E4SZ57_9ASCO|nr:hypothetical protein CANARDRAFT_200428 [[Candida] arabinofermentans NRRL YB-2248]
MLRGQLRRSIASARKSTIRSFHSTSRALKVEEVSSYPDFKEKVLKDKFALVDFYATWCAPCKAISPLVEKFSEQYANDVKFYKVDVDNSGDTPAVYGVTAMPTFLLFKNGEKVFSIVGANPQGIKQVLDAAVKGDL